MVDGNAVGVPPPLPPPAQAQQGRAAGQQHGARGLGRGGEEEICLHVTPASTTPGGEFNNHPDRQNHDPSLLPKIGTPTRLAVSAAPRGIACRFPLVWHFHGRRESGGFSQ